MHDILVRIPLPFGGASLPIHSYGVMAMIGFLVALAVARWRAKQVGLSADHVTDLALFALLGGIVGSRAFYVVQNWSYFADRTRPDWSVLDAIKIWQGGLVFYGGLILAAILVVWIARKRGMRLTAVLDVLAPSMALGHAFGRIGCFLRGCCFGAPVKAGAWYGVVFPDDSLPYDPYAEHTCAAGTPIFPVQLLSSLNLLVIFGVLMFFFKRRRGEGQVIGLYVILYSIHRFLVEFLRGDTHVPGALSPAQWISVPGFFLGLWLFVWARGRKVAVGAPKK